MNSRHSLKTIKARTGAAATPRRRGNALVLAAGILVLLVIIATAYVSRTQSEREMSAATQRAETRDAVAGVLAEDIARQLADSLFVRAVDGFDPAFPGDPHDPQTATTGGGVADANYPRGPLQSDAVRYSFDVPFPYNFAPYYVVPWTNWPDFATLDNIYGAAFSTYVPPNGDRVGNPGFGDTRWLRDSEPMRLVIDDPTPKLPNSGDELVVYTHFLHLSNIARAENGWRICSDISDIGDQFTETGLPNFDFLGMLVTELNFPVEQWLPMYWNQDAVLYNYAPANLDVLTPGALTDIRAGGNPAIVTAADLPPPLGTNQFMFRWARWFFPEATVGGAFGPDPGYPNQFRGLIGFGIPANFLNLRDLDGDGVVHNFGDRPEDEFIRGSARHTVARVLTDTDGDGFTDSYWFLAPTSSVAGTRTIVGVSIIDNAGKLDLNAASRGMMADVNLDQESTVGGSHDIDEGFNPLGIVPTGAPSGFIPRDPHTATVGHTPADLALAGYPFEQGSFGSSGTADLPAAWADQWNVGLFDNWIHHEANWPWILALPGAAGALPAAAYDPESPFGEMNATWWWHMWSQDLTDSSDDGDPARRYNFLQQLGVVLPSAGFAQGSGFFPDMLRTQEDRRRYWLHAGRKPFSPDWELTPFTLADEIELRMFHGNNYPWVLSRFERSMQDHWDSNEGSQLFRGSVTREESNEYLDQLVNYELVRDLRGKSTFFSSTRNDLLPPWLWWEPHEISGDLELPDRIQDLIGAALSQAEVDAIRNTFFAQSRRKLDLRDGLSTAVEPAYFETFPRRGELSFHERLPYMLRLALYDYYGDDGYEASEDDTEQTAAALAANIEAYRSGPYVDPTDPTITTRGDELQYPDAEDAQFIPIAAGGTGIATPRERANRAVLVNPDGAVSDRMLGLERQPFIVEAFIAHVYPRATLAQGAGGFDAWYDAQPGSPTQPPPTGDFDPNYIPVDPDPLDGFNFDFGVQPQTPFVDASSPPTTIVVVQIANPFTESDESGVAFDEQGIDLHDYAIRVCGTDNIVRLDQVPDLAEGPPVITGVNPIPRRYLKPGTEEKPRTAVFYSITNSGTTLEPTPLLQFKLRWLEFLDLPFIASPPAATTTPFPDFPDWDVYVDPAQPDEDYTIVADVTNQGWSLDPIDYYDFAGGGADEHAVELLRKVTYPDDRIEWVVVDRSGASDSSGGENDELTRRLGELPRPPAASIDTDWAADVFNGVQLRKPSGHTGTIIECDYWVPWVRMTRAWGYDFNFDSSAPDDDGDADFGEPEDSNGVPERLGIQADERAPRFVFGREFVTKADNAPNHVGEPAIGPNLTWESDMYQSVTVPGGTLTDPDEPWFDKQHALYTASPPLELRRKPFFFTMNPVYVLDDAGWTDPITSAPDADSLPDDVYLPFNGGTMPGPSGATVQRYGHQFWYVDQTNPSASSFATWISFPVTATPGPSGAGVPSKGLLEAETGAVLSEGAEPSDGNALAFRNFFPHSLQMNQKDGDFEQVGELFNLWLHGHELGPAASFDTVTAASTDPLSDPQKIWDTKVTFTERMGQLVGTEPNPLDDPGPRVNRLSFGPVIGDVDDNPPHDERNHSFPALPAGLRVLDAFVCDGPGRDAYVTDFDGDGTVALDEQPPGVYLGVITDVDDYVTAEDRAFRNAQGFAGAGTPGLLNLNTATIEALRSLPQGAAIVNELFRLRNVPTAPPSTLSWFIRSDNYLADALVHYRDCLAALPPDAGDPPTQQWEPTYAALNPLLNPNPGDPALMEAMRSGYPPSGVGDPVIPTGIRNELGESNPLVTIISDLEDLRGERGFASIGEIALAVNQPNADVSTYPALIPAPPTPPPGPAAAASAVIFYPYRWRMDMLGHPEVEMFDPFSGIAPWTQTPEDQPVSASLSVDTTKIFDTSVIEYADGQMVPDRTAKDNEELNMLMAGMSNLVSTRSDMFTVYLKVRTFRQDPATGRWDATKKENILDDSRYVMLVDRSNVNKPTDKPRILYFEKVAK